MSKIAIAGATTGTGTFTLASPATNTDRVLTLPDEAGTVLTTAGVPASAMPAGSVLQVATVLLDTDQTIATASFVDITNASISFTPKSATSKIIVRGYVHVYISGGSAWHSLILRAVRDSTDLGGWLVTDPYSQGNNGLGESMHQPLISRTDTLGSTTPVTYKLQGYSKNSYISRINNFSYGFFEVMEVSQ